MSDPQISHEQMLTLFSYNPETGLFTYLYGKSKGKIAGHSNGNGYIRIWINKNHVLAHRLAWFFVYKKWPGQCIDHINHDKSDNRIKNLRDVSLCVNSNNRKSNRNRKLKIIPFKLNAKKIQEYLNKQQRSISWLAREIGISPSLMSYRLQQRLPVDADLIANAIGETDPKNLIVVE